MGTLKSLIATTIIGAPTSTTLYTVEPPQKLLDAKQSIKDGFKGAKDSIKEAKDDVVEGVKSKAKKTTDISENIKLNNKKINNVIKTTLATGTTTSTTTIGNAINNHYLNKIEHHKSLTTYVNAMSEEELTEALERLNLLDSEDNSETYSKTR